MFSGSLNINFRGAIAEILYRRTIDDVEWCFAMDRLNDVPLKPQERQAIRAAVLERVR